MSGFRPVFSREVSKAWGEVTEQRLKEQLLCYALSCCQSLSVALDFFSWSPRGAGAAWERWQRAQWQPQPRVPTDYQNSTPRFTECAGPLMHRSLCETEFYSGIHYIKRRFVPQSSTSQSYLHCAWNPGKHAALFRPKWQQIMLRYHWDIHTDSNKK